MREITGLSVPWRVILVLLCAVPPVGAILLLLKVVVLVIPSDYTAKDKTKTMKSPAPVKKKRKHLSHIMRVIAMLYFTGAAFLFCQGVAGGAAALKSCGGLVLYLLLCGCACRIYSAWMYRRERIDARYLQIMDGAKCISLKRLSSLTSRRLCFVRRDIQRLIDSGALGNGAYIDMKTGCLMRLADSVPVTETHYKRTLSGHDTAAWNALPEIGVEEYDVVLRRFSALVSSISNERVLLCVQRIGYATREIFAYTVRVPERRGMLRRFENYYLPTVLKLLESYCMLERIRSRGQNKEAVRQEIEARLDEWAVGFERQLDQLYRYERDDVFAETEVLSGMMVRDGLKDDADFMPPASSAHTSGICEQ